MKITFPDHPEFTPNLTPRDIFIRGAFGGVYWRPIYSSVTKKHYRDVYKKYKCLAGIDKSLLDGGECDISKNKYKVHSGTSLEYWESKGWIKPQDPYGWVQWYCEFYEGRRTEDDNRQIKRWLAFAGPKGRFYRRLVGMIKKKRTKYNDYSISPVIRQGLLHWATEITAEDLR